MCNGATQTTVDWFWRWKTCYNQLSVDAGIPSIYGGVGLNIVNETIGQYDNLGLQLSYAYRTELGNGQVGTGISLGMYQSSLDGSLLSPASSGDPALPTADAKALLLISVLEYTITMKTPTLVYQVQISLNQLLSGKMLQRKSWSDIIT